MVTMINLPMVACTIPWDWWKRSMVMLKTLEWWFWHSGTWWNWIDLAFV
jgi:hypothetical protein